MKRSKIIAALAVAATMTLGGALALTGCTEHVHSYTEWKHDDAGHHWQECPDDGEKNESSYGDHRFDGDTDATCNDCGYVRDLSVQAEKGTLSGTVTANGKALGGVKVAVGSNDTVTSATGKYSLAGVEIKDGVTVTFTKKDYAAVTRTISKTDWTDKAATLDVTMTPAAEKTIVGGTVKYGNKLVEGATVTLGTEAPVTTGADGKYSIELSSSAAAALTLKVTHPAFKDYTAEIDIEAGAANVKKDVLLTAKIVPVIEKSYYELKALEASEVSDFKHRQNENMWYVQHGPDGHRVINDHGEGLCLHVDNNATDEDMVPAIYQKLAITSANSKMMFRARGFLGANDKHGLLSVRVVDLNGYTVDELKQSASDSSAWYKMDSNGYVEYKYDLSAYKGKEVVVIIGAKQGNHNAIERIRFIGENEDWVMPFTTAADLESLTASAAQNMDGVDAIKSALNDSSWVKVGDQSGANEGWLFKDADYAEEGTDALRVFTYKKLTFSNTGSIILRARTFGGQNSVTGHDGQIYPEIIIRLIDSEGNLVNVTSTFNRVDDGNRCQSYYFKLSEEIAGDYTFVLGMARGQRMAVESIKFGTAMTSVNVTGTVKSGGAAVAGATVKYGYNRGSATTAADGTFTLPVDIAAGEDIQLTVSKDGYADVTKTVTGSSDAALGEVTLLKTILPNLTTEDIAGMTALTGEKFGTDSLFDSWRKYGDVDKHGEGTCLQANANSPAYICAKIAIDASKQYMKLNARMFVRDSDQRGLIKVQVIKADGTVETLKPIRVYHANDVLEGKVLDEEYLINDADSYNEGVYDLTAYVGQTIVIAIIGVNDKEAVTKAIHNAISDVSFKENSDTAFGKPAVTG